MEKEPVKVNLSTVFFLVIIFLLIIVLMVVYYFGFLKVDNQSITIDNTSEYSTTQNDNNKTKIDIDESLIKKLYSNLESKGYLTNAMLSFPAHNSKVGKRELLTDEDIIFISYCSMDLDKDFEKVYDEDILDHFNIYEFYSDEKGKFLYAISSEKILDKAKELFGNDISINSYDVHIAMSILYYNQKYYQVKDVPASGGDIYHDAWISDYFENIKDDTELFMTCGFSLYDKYELKDNEIYVYEYYINAFNIEYLSNNLEACRTSNYNENEIVKFSYDEYLSLSDNIWTEELKEKAGYYKHTFKKDSSNNYYWDSAELIKKTTSSDIKIEGTYSLISDEKQFEGENYIFFGNEVRHETLALDEGTFEVDGDRIKITYTKSYEPGETTPLNKVSSPEELTIIDKNTLKDSLGNKYVKE